MPGHNGGANWGSSAVDPRNGRLFVVSKELPVYDKLRAPETVLGPGGRAGGGGSPGGGNRPPPLPPPNAGRRLHSVRGAGRLHDPPSTGLSAIGPPWSQITAYDLNKGTILWQVPDGEVSKLAPVTGTGSHAPRGGPVATAGGLLFIGTSSDRTFRAYDSDTGKVLWSRRVARGARGRAGRLLRPAGASTSRSRSAATGCSART